MAPSAPGAMVREKEICRCEHDLVKMDECVTGMMEPTEGLLCLLPMMSVRFEACVHLFFLFHVCKTHPP